MSKPITWTTEQRIVKDLVPYEYNPRILTEGRKQNLKKSLEKFNLAEIPAINTDNLIIAGHQRIKALMELGRADEVIDVRMPSRALTKAEFKEYNIVSNIPVGIWDVDVLDEFFDDIDLEALGLDVDNIEFPESILGKNFKKEEETDLDIDPPLNPISKPGDVYELISPSKKIKHFVIAGDSLKSETYHTILKSEKIDLLITDPPYNVDYEGGTSEKLKIQNDKMSNKSFYQFLFDFYSNMQEYLKEVGCFYIFHASTESKNFISALQDSGLKLSQNLIWQKNTFVLGRQDYHWKHEPILYGWKLGAAHYFIEDRSKSTIFEENIDFSNLKKKELLEILEDIKKNSDVFYYDKPLRNGEHPTMKPIELINEFLFNSSRPNEIIGDFFGGSGSTLISCEQMKRNARIIELDERFIDVIVRRWIKYMVENSLEYQVIKNGQTLSKELESELINR